MNRRLKVLLIEDHEIDVILILRYLKQYWAEVNYLKVQNIAKLTKALKSDWDIILSDFNLPGFDGMTALRLIRESGINTPFILVSGEVSEDVATLMMRLGANDYVMKNKLYQLVPAILRGLKEERNTIIPEAPNSGKTEKVKLQKSSAKLLPHYAPDESEAPANTPISERHKAIVNMLFVTEFIRRHQAAVLEKQNLNVQRFGILKILKRVYPGRISVKSIKKEIAYKTIDLSRMIEKMKKEGLIETEINWTDHRAKEIVMTRKGLEVLNEADKNYDEMFLSENYLSEENAKKINEALHKTLTMVK